MLARVHRLTQGRDFSSVVRAGRRAGRPTLVVHLSGAGDRDDAPRVGLVVGKTVGNAVTRNQVKRRLRHVARERIGSLPGGAMLVVRALPPSRDASSATLARELDLALGRLLGGGSA